MSFKNCHDLPSSCWLYTGCNEVGFWPTFSDRYPSLKKYLSLKQFSQVKIDPSLFSTRPGTQIPDYT